MKQKQEDHDLVREQFAELNREFYSTESPPQDYIGDRLRAIFLATSDSRLVKEANEAGFVVGDLKVGYKGDDALLTKQAASDYLTIESTVLLHHAAEAFFRLFLAHRGGPECPWLETARLRDFRLFKKEVQGLLDNLDEPESQADLMHVLTGRRDHDAGAGGLTLNQWNDNREAVVQLVRTLAKLLLSDANLYNAAKHGLAIVPGDVGMRLGSEAKIGIDFSVDGPSLRFLETVDINPGKNPGKAWQKTVSWIRAESQLALIYLVSQEIENIWSVGKLRYVGSPGGVSLHAISPKMIEIAERAGRSDHLFQIDRMGERLLYYVAEPDAPDAPHAPRAPRERRT